MHQADQTNLFGSIKTHHRSPKKRPLSTMSNSTIVLSGTKAELTSLRALKVLAAASRTSTPIQRRVLTNDESLSSLTVLAKSLVLTLPDGKTNIGGTSNCLMRVLASLSPYSGLLDGSQLSTWTSAAATNMNVSLVDSWMQFSTTSFEVPLSALHQASNDGVGEGAMVEAVKADLSAALTILDRQLMCRTYMVGNDVTCADISLACAITDGMDLKLSLDDFVKLDGNDGKFANVSRWYSTIINQDFFLKAKSELRKLCDG